MLRIPQKDFYRLLGIKPDATTAQVKESYKALIRVFHADLAVPELSAIATEINQELNEARE